MMMLAVVAGGGKGSRGSVNGGMKCGEPEVTEQVVTSCAERDRGPIPTDQLKNI